MTENVTTTHNTIDYGGRTFTLLYSDLVPPHTPDERADLKESIRLNGIKHQILHTCDDVVVDGGTRMEIALELEIPLEELPLKEIEVDQDQAVALAVQLNSCRRQWTRERRVLVVHRLRRRHGWSARKIAEVIGTSHTIVNSDLKEPDPEGESAPAGGSGGNNFPPDRVTGADGKSYPAVQPPRTAPSDTAGQNGDGSGGNNFPGEAEASPAVESPDRHDVRSVEPVEGDADNAVAPPKPPVRPQDDNKRLREAIKLFGSVARSCAILGKLEAVVGDLAKIAGALGLSVSDRDAEIEKLRAACKQLLAIAEEAGVYQSTKAAWRHLYNSVVENKQNAATQAFAQADAVPASATTSSGTGVRHDQPSKPVRKPHSDSTDIGDDPADRDYHRQEQPTDDCQDIASPDDEVEVVL